MTASRAHALPAAAGPAPVAPASADVARQQRLRKVAQEFEALLVNTLLRSMRETVPESGLIESDGALAQYRSLYDEELARAASRGDTGLGIAELIVSRYGEPARGAAGVGPAAADPGADADWPLRAGAPARAPRPRPAPDPSAATAVARALAQGRGVPGGGPETPAEGVLGPPAPPAGAGPTVGAAAATPPQRARGLVAYRLQAERDERVAGLAALRAAAEREGGVVADSLRRFDREIAEASEATGVDPALLLSVLVQESGGDPRARSPQGALGLMQLMPGTAREVGVGQPLHPGQSLLGGARYLARMLDRFDQRLELALAGYNAGPGAVERAGGVPGFRETLGYVAKVGALYERLRGGAGTELATDPAP